MLQTETCLPKHKQAVWGPDLWFMGSLHGELTARGDHEPLTKVGRVTPCAPFGVRVVS